MKPELVAIVANTIMHNTQYNHVDSIHLTLIFDELYMWDKMIHAYTAMLT